MPEHASLGVLLTHPDADHIRNIEPLLAEQRVVIDGLVMSAFATDTQTRTRLIAQLATTYREEKLPGSPVSVWRRPGDEISLRLVRLAPAIGRPSRVARFTADAGDGVTVDVMQLRAPRTSNDSSLVTRVAFNGHATLYAADMSITAMKAFSDHYEQQVRRHRPVDGIDASKIPNGLPLPADTLKWPHHAWLPRDDGARKELARFVRHVNPSRVLVSVAPGELRGQSVEDVKKFLRDVLDNPVVLVTREDGHIQLKSRLEVDGSGAVADSF